MHHSIYLVMLQYLNLTLSILINMNYGGFLYCYQSNMFKKILVNTHQMINELYEL